MKGIMKSTSTKNMKAPKTSTAVITPVDRQADYQTLKTELDEVMASLEQGELDIDAAVACYERGLGIIKTLEDHLLKAENRIAELKADHQDGEPDDEELSEEE